MSYLSFSNQGLDKLIDICKSTPKFTEETYKKNQVKRGLRDENGAGVITGLTDISDVIAKKNDIPIYATRQSAVKFSCDSPVRAHLCERDILFSEDIGDMHISSFQTSHDSLMSVGYRIEYSDDDGLHSIGYATDTGYISDGIRTALLGCDAVVLECNHDVDMLMRGPYPYDLKRRVASCRGHLSNNDCADFSLDLVQNGTRAILLAHVSRENNDPTIAFDTVSNAISGFNVNLAIAEPFAPTELVIPKKED